MISYIKRSCLLFTFIFGTTLFVDDVFASTKGAFCRDYSDEKTPYWFNSRYRYEWEKNYQYCLQNADYLIEMYEFGKLSWREQDRIIKDIEKKNKEALEKKRLREIEEKERLERIANPREPRKPRDMNAYYVRQYIKFKTYEDICLNNPPLNPNYDFDCITYRELKGKYNWDLIKRTYKLE